ncbi:MAG TPA: VWA domain-containing protein, partial [Candidatus Limnocylindrales bacterium]
QFWRRRGRKLPATRPDAPVNPDADRDEDGEPGAADDAAEGRETTLAEIARLGIQESVDAEDGEQIEGETISPDAWSRGEILRHRDFDRMTSAELRDAERFVDLLRPRLERRRTRRHELHPHGRKLAPRAMYRRNLATGELTDWVWRRQIREPRQLVILCDISGSMERHSRLLLRFVQALARENEVRTESFVFGTRLTRVTRLMKDRDRDRALARVADSVTDWAGGTRIGESFRQFNHNWARRTLRSSGVVIVVSDGWDRGDPSLVAAETARLRRNCHRLVWLNPLASSPGYQPLAAGMRAAYPFIDDFLPAGTLASLERLGHVLAGGTLGTARWGSAVTHATTVAPSLGLTAPEAAAPKPLGGTPVPPDQARPLG